MSDSSDDETGAYIRLGYTGGYQDVPFSAVEDLVTKFGPTPGQEVINAKTYCPNTKTKARVVAVAESKTLLLSKFEGTDEQQTARQNHKRAPKPKVDLNFVHPNDLKKQKKQADAGRKAKTAETKKKKQNLIETKAANNLTQRVLSGHIFADENGKVNENSGLNKQVEALQRELEATKAKNAALELELSQQPLSQPQGLEGSDHEGRPESQETHFNHEDGGQLDESDNENMVPNRNLSSQRGPNSSSNESSSSEDEVVRKPGPKILNKKGGAKERTRNMKVSSKPVPRSESSSSENSLRSGSQKSYRRRKGLAYALQTSSNSSGSSSEGSHRSPKTTQLKKRKYRSQATSSDGSQSSTVERSRSKRLRSPTKERTRSPSTERSRSPSTERSRSPTKERSRIPTKERPRSPTKDRSRSPTKERSRSPTKERSRSPTMSMNEEGQIPIDEGQEAATGVPTQRGNGSQLTLFREMQKLAAIYKDPKNQVIYKESPMVADKRSFIKIKNVYFPRVKLGAELRKAMSPGQVIGVMLSLAVERDALYVVTLHGSQRSNDDKMPRVRLSDDVVESIKEKLREMGAIVQATGVVSQPGEKKKKGQMKKRFTENDLQLTEVVRYKSHWPADLLDSRNLKPLNHMINQFLGRQREKFKKLVAAN